MVVKVEVSKSNPSKYATCLESDFVFSANFVNGICGIVILVNQNHQIETLEE
jgi:hypothetical protein